MMLAEEKKSRKEEEGTGRKGDRERKSQVLANLNSQLSTLKSQPISIRAYQSSDYPIVLALWLEAKLRPFLEAEVERLLSSGGGALVAVVQDSSSPQEEGRAASSTEQVVGIILWSHNGSIGILWRLAVAESQRGRGIATKLLDRAEHDIRAVGLSGVTLLTRVTNTVAKNMYAKRGYKHNDHLEFWGKKWRDSDETLAASSHSILDKEPASC